MAHGDTHRPRTRDRCRAAQDVARYGATRSDRTPIPRAPPSRQPGRPLVLQLVRQLLPLHLGAVGHVRQPGPGGVFECQHESGLLHLLILAPLVIVAQIPLHILGDQRQLVLGQIPYRLQISLHLGDHPVEALPWNCSVSCHCFCSSAMKASYPFDVCPWPLPSTEP